MTTPSKDVLTKPRVILCEGAQDKAFFRKLIKARDLPEFDILHPSDEKDNGKTGGREGIGDRLASLKFANGVENVSGILIVSDNDGDPASSFEDVRQQILQVDGCTPPNCPEVAAKGHGLLPPLVVLMLPEKDKIGALESLCLPAISDQHPDLAECARSLEVCTKINVWPQTKRDKAILRVMISTACKKDPNTGLAYAWDRPIVLIPLDHSCFDPITSFLRNFDNLLT